MRATSVPFNMSWHVGHCYSSEASKLNKILDCFLPLEAYKILSGIMKGSPAEGAFQVRSREGFLIVLFVLFKVSGVFSYWALPSTSERKSKITTIADTALKVT